MKKEMAINMDKKTSEIIIIPTIAAKI